MAIRKLRSKMKPVIWGITIAFFLSFIALIIANLKLGASNNMYAFKINGQKVKEQVVDRAFNDVVNRNSANPEKKIDKESLKIIEFNKVIDNELLKGMRKKYGVKVSGKDVKEEFKAATAGIQDKKQLKRALQYQGFTTSSYKVYLKESLLASKTKDAIFKSYKYGDEQLKEEYEAGLYGSYYGQTFEEVKDQIKIKVENRGGTKTLSIALEKARKNMKLDKVNKANSKYLSKVIYEDEGFEVTNVDIAKRKTMYLNIGMSMDEKTDEKILDNIKKEIEMSKTAKAAGIVVDADLALMDKLYEYRLKYKSYLMKTTEVKDIEISKYFEKHKAKYDVKASFDAEIAIIKIAPGESEKIETTKKAEELLKKLTPENFAEMAKINSEGPSNVKGGDLGWFGEKQMVKPFEDAVKAGKVGEVYPKVVETQFGSHLIYVVAKKTEDGKVQYKASHILLIPKATDATKENLVKKLLK